MSTHRHRVLLVLGVLSVAGALIGLVLDLGGKGMAPPTTRAAREVPARAPSVPPWRGAKVPTAPSSAASAQGEPEAASVRLVGDLLAALSRQDEDFFRDLMPPEVADNSGGRYDWGNLVEELAKQSAALEHQVKVSGPASVVVWRDGEALVTLYRAQGFPSGHALRFRPAGDGWHLVGRRWLAGE